MGFELKILTDLSAMPKVVETNIDEVGPVIEAAIKKTEGLVVTDNKDDIIAVDADAAKLTKMADAIKRFRIDHIALWKEPMEAFETKCKAAEKKLTEAAATLRTKTGEVKELWRQRKLEKCRKLWMERLAAAFGEGSEAAKSEGQAAFFNFWTDQKTKGTWLNSSVTETAVGSAMDAEIERMKQTIEAFKVNYDGQPSEVLARAELALFRRFDLNDVVQAVAAWKKEQEAIAERARAAEAAKAERLARETAREEKVAPVAAPTPTAAPVTTDAPNSPAPVETYKLEITGTRAALTKLREYGITLGITFKNMEA